MTADFALLDNPFVDGCRQHGLLYAGSLTAIAALWYLMRGGQLNLIVAVMIAAALVLVLVRDAATSAVMTLAYLHLLGDLRRLADVATGVPEKDLLLLVGPALTILLAMPVMLRLQVKDTLSKAMLALTLLMAVEVINPAQGGIAVGISGALFYLVPVLWFWIGRSLASPAVLERLLYYVIFPLAVLAAMLGLTQTLVGFFPYEQSWIDATLRNYTALSLGGTTRAFGFSVSAAEYATLLELAAAGVAAAWFGTRRVWILAFPLLCGAMLLASGRTVVVKLILALAVIWVLRRGQKLTPGAALRLGLLLVAGLGAVSVLASSFMPAGASAGPQTATQESMAHLSGGLAHPFDERYSTVGIHQGMFVRAIVGSFTSPLGLGLGATTGASTKFTGSSEVYSSEIDFSDMFIILGPVGGLLYLSIFCMAMRSAMRYVSRTQLTVSLPVVGILSSTIAAWLISGQYSTSALVFFLIGATAYTRPDTVLPDAASIPVEEPSLAAREALEQPEEEPLLAYQAS